MNESKIREAIALAKKIQARGVWFRHNVGPLLDAVVACEKPEPLPIREGVWRTRHGKLCGVYLRENLPEGATTTFINPERYPWYCRYSTAWCTVAANGMQFSGRYPETGGDLIEFVCPLPPDRRAVILNCKAGDKLPRDGKLLRFSPHSREWVPCVYDTAEAGGIYAHLPAKFCEPAEPTPATAQPQAKPLAFTYYAMMQEG
jgi:hypothetical protein